jgi:hypothetical protein
MDPLTAFFVEQSTKSDDEVHTTARDPSTSSKRAHESNEPDLTAGSSGLGTSAKIPKTTIAENVNEGSQAGKPSVYF